MHEIQCRLGTGGPLSALASSDEIMKGRVFVSKVDRLLRELARRAINACGSILLGLPCFPSNEEGIGGYQTTSSQKKGGNPEGLDLANIKDNLIHQD